jgi:hypothetical protein
LIHQGQFLISQYKQSNIKQNADVFVPQMDRLDITSDPLRKDLQELINRCCGVEKTARPKMRAVVSSLLKAQGKKKNFVGMFDAGLSREGSFSKKAKTQPLLDRMVPKLQLFPNKASFSARNLKPSFFETKKEQAHLPKRKRHEREWDEVTSSDCTEMDDLAITGNAALRTKRSKLPAADIFPGDTQQQQSTRRQKQPAAREETELKRTTPVILFFHMLLTNECPNNNKNSVPNSVTDSGFTHSIIGCIIAKKYPGRSAAEVLSTQSKVQIDYLFEFWKKGVTITQGEWLEKHNNRTVNPAWKLLRYVHREKFGYVVPARMAGEEPGQGETDKTIVEIRKFTDENWVGAPYGHHKGGYRCFDFTGDLMSWIRTNERSLPPNRGPSH